MPEDTDLTAEETEDAEKLVKILDAYLFGWEYRQIEQASVQGPAKLAGFILGACFIDAMAGFYGGVVKETASRGSGKRFREFVGEYMPDYKAEDLWRDLRCGLVHSYAEGGTYAFVDDKQLLHLTKTPKGMIVLNLEDFCADLRRAYRSLRQDILTDRKILQKANRRFRSMGIMMAGPIDQL